MTINQHSANVQKIAANVFSYEGSIKTSESLCISFPKCTTLMVKGNISVKDGLTVKNCDLQVYGNITALKIESDGDLGAVEGTIFAPNGINSLGTVNAGKSIFCDNGKVVAAGGVFAETVYCLD